MNGEQIKEIRHKAFMSQRQFAKELGVNFNTVCSWENGYKKPRLSNLKVIKEFCDKHKISIK